MGIGISVTDYSEAVRVICQHARQGLGGAVGALAIHAVMEATREPTIGRCVNGLEMATPDGQGVRWALNLIHRTGLKDRVYGPELTLRLAAEAARQGLRLFLFGSTPPVAWGMKSALERRFPGLEIVGVDCPTKWPWSRQDDEDYTRRIRNSGAQIVLVGLGCPRQEQWIYEHRAQLKAVLISVGAAFDFISGAKRQAPAWVQKHGLEMVFRTCLEPRRLWRRFLFNSPAFVVRVLVEWLFLHARPASYREGKQPVQARNPPEAFRQGSARHARSEAAGR